jgi:chromosome segregation ATPase
VHSAYMSLMQKEDQLSKLVSDKNELLAMNTQLRKEFASLTSDLELALDHRLAKGAEEIAKYKQLCDNLQTELETVKHNNLNLKREFDEKTERIMNKHLSEMDGLDKQHSEELSVLRNQLMDLDNSVDQLKPLQDKLTEKQSLLSLKESVIRDLMEQIETLKFKHDEGKIEKLEHERQSLIADLQASREALAEKDTVIQYVSSELETIKAELEIKNEKRVNEIQEQLKQAVEAIRILESQLDSQIETNHNLNTQLGKLEIEKENLYTLSRQRMHKLSAVVAALSDD